MTVGTIESKGLIISKHFVTKRLTYARHTKSSYTIIYILFEKQHCFHSLSIVFVAFKSIKQLLVTTVNSGVQCSMLNGYNLQV